MRTLRIRVNVSLRKSIFESSIFLPQSNFWWKKWIMQNNLLESVKRKLEPLHAFATFTIIPLNTEVNQKFLGTKRGYDDREICRLVGIYILYILAEKYGYINTAWYRGYSLAYFENLGWYRAKFLWNNVIDIFRKEFKLNIFRCNFYLKKWKIPVLQQTQ